MAIENHIKATVPDIRWIDADEQQLDTTDRPPIAFPACLITISYPQCETLMGGRQKIHARVELRVAFGPIQGSTNAVAPTHVREQTLARFDVLSHLHDALQWYTADRLFNPLRRISSMPERHSNGIKVYKVIYETEFLD